MYRLFQYLPFLIGLIILPSSCGDGDDSRNGTNGDGTNTVRRLTEKIPVQTHIIQKGTVIDLVTATGTVFPLHDVLVSSQTAGTVTDIQVDVGDWVNKGDILVQVDPELKELALQQAEAKLLEAKAAFGKASKDFERNKQLFESKDISEYIFESVRLQKGSAEAAHSMAQTNVKMAKRQLKDTRITSPVNGFVAARLVELGGMVAPGAPIAKVVDINQVKVKFGVAEKDIVKIEKGQPATISVDSYQDLKFSGKVSSVGPQANLSTRTFPIEVLVDNPESRLKAGMIAEVKVATQTLSDVLLLPKSALLERANQTLIFVIKKGVAEKRIPKLGIESGKNRVVLEGADSGEEVVILGQENLLDGTNVVVRNSFRN